MKAYLFMVTFTAVIALVVFVAVQRSTEAGVVVSESESSDDQQAQELHALPNYAEQDDEETRKRMRRQQQPPARSSGQATSRSGAAAATPSGTYSQPQMPLPPTYAPGAPASRQPASASQLPTPPTSHGLYNSPNDVGGSSGIGLPTPGQALPAQPGSMAVQQPTLGLPPSPTASLPMATSRGTVTDQRMYGPQSPTGVSQSATPQPSVATHRQPSTMPSGGAKPFKDYRRKSPYSPYMSLFRSQDTDRGINNYYSYVRPALDQSRQNSQFNRNISSLQRAASFQNKSIERINQENQARQRPGNIIPGANVPQRMPATFMNLQKYYPGYQ